jgi:hypothetical protein
MITYIYFDIEIVEGQEPTISQIRELMEVKNLDYYSCQEELREVSYGTPPLGFETWLEYFIENKQIA